MKSRKKKVQILNFFGTGIKRTVKAYELGIKSWN